MQDNPHFGGETAEYRVALWFLERGYNVSQPMVRDHYDLVVDIGETMLRVQVKRTQQHDAKSWAADLRRVENSTEPKREYPKDSVDGFAVVHEPTGEIFWLWPESAPQRPCRLLDTWREGFAIDKQLDFLLS